MKKNKKKRILMVAGVTIMILCTSCSNKKANKSDKVEDNTVVTTDSVTDPKSEADAAYFNSKLTEVRYSFSDIYSSQAMGYKTMKIDEVEIDAETTMGASMKRYLTKDKEPLRYTITYFGETGQKQEDYYIDDFGIFVSEITMHYASKVVNADYFDPLYTEVENYCIKDNKIYELTKDGAVLSDKQLDYTTVEQLEDLYKSGSKSEN